MLNQADIDKTREKLQDRLWASGGSSRRQDHIDARNALVAFERAEAVMEEHEQTSDHRRTERWGQLHGCARCQNAEATLAAIIEQTLTEVRMKTPTEALEPVMAELEPPNCPTATVDDVDALQAAIIALVIGELEALGCPDPGEEYDSRMRAINPDFPLCTRCQRLAEWRAL